jgi:hypothetical protein
MGIGRTFVTTAFLVLASAGADAVAAPTPGKPDDEAVREELLFSVKLWQGEYASKDVPGGGQPRPSSAPATRCERTGPA